MRSGSRLGQSEMIGLVFVVVILIAGILFYFSISGSVHEAPRSTTPYLVALSETTIPACGVTVEEAAAACATGKRLRCDACANLQSTMDTIARQTLAAEGYSFNLSLTGTGVEVSNCNSADPKVELVSGWRKPVPLGDGRTNDLVLSICK